MEDPCLICGGVTKGLQYQVIACRGCASFFRRSIKDEKEYRCDSGTGKCTLKKGDVFCKYCRLKRCKEVGMEMEKDKPMHQLEMNENFENTALSQNVTTIEIDEEILTLTNLVQDKLILKVDVTPLEIVIKNIFDTRTPIPIESTVKLTCFQQIYYGFSKVLKEFYPKTPVKLVNTFDFHAYMKFFEKFLIELTKTLMHCRPFAELSLNDKLLLLKHVLPIIHTIERAYTSIQFFGPNSYSTKILMLHDDQLYFEYSDTNLCIFKYKGFQTDAIKQAKPFWEKVKNKTISYIIMPMAKLQLSEYEMVYLLAHALWNIPDSPGFSEDAIRLCDDLSQQIDSELHNYYVYDLKLTNYAHRLIKMTKLIEACKDIEKDKSEIHVIAKIFDLFHVETTGTLNWC